MCDNAKKIGERINSESNSVIPRNSLHLETSTNEGNQFIHRYDSPFFTPDITNQSDSSCTVPAALIILNTHIRINNNPCINSKTLSGVLGVLWKSSSYRICADGGANRLYEVTVLSGTNNSHDDITDENVYIPDLITGDLDSLLPHVRIYYEKRGVPIVQIVDQNFHDLDKALMAVEKWIHGNNFHPSDNTNSLEASYTPIKTFIYGAFGGRFDQEMGCLNALLSWRKKRSFRFVSMALYGEENCAFALPGQPMVSEIRVRFPNGADKIKYLREVNNETLIGEGPTCGLIPLGTQCEHVYTKGLQWDLDGSIPLEFGGLVSSSNRVIDEVVTVRSSSTLIFTTEIIKKNLS